MMRKILIGGALAALAAPVWGQTKVDLRTQTKSVDFSAAGATRPVKLGNTLPAACTVGELFFLTGAEAGKNLFGCAAANQWKILTGAPVASGCGLMGCESGTCQVDSAVIPSYTGPLAAHGVVTAADGATLKTMTPGAPGLVLMSNGADADPSWATTALFTNHAGLSNLDYESSGHTGFQAALGFTPERALTFQGALIRTGDTISCPTCPFLAEADPATCTEGSLYYNTATDRLRQCTAAETWADLTGGGGGTAAPSGAPNAIQYNGGGALAGVAVNAEAKRKFLSQLSGGAPVLEALRAEDVPPRVVPMYPSVSAAKCRAGVAVSNFNLPPANAPTAVCQAGSTYGAVLRFAAKTTQSFLEHIQLPGDWSNAPNSIDLELAGRSDDAAHAVSISVQYACVGTEGGIDNLTFADAGSVSFVAGAGARRTRTTIPALNASGCSANDEYYFRVIVSTDPAATAGYDLISLRPVVRRTF